MRFIWLSFVIVLIITGYAVYLAYEAVGMWALRSACAGFGAGFMIGGISALARRMGRGWR